MTIGRKLALLVVLAVASCMTAYAIYTIRARRAELLEEAAAEASDLGATLDIVLNEVLVERDLVELRYLPDDISRARRIYGLALYDARDDTMIASRTVASRRHDLRNMAERVARRARPEVVRPLWFGSTETAAYAFPLRRHGREVVGAAVVLRDESYMRGLIAASRNRIAVAGSVVAVLAVLVILGVTRQTLVRPVRELIEGVRRIGEGDLAHPIAIRAPDEVGRIADALNRMTRDLAAARDQIRADLEARIELKKSVEFERRLQQAQRLAAVGQVAASLAHEIGSPLHVIAGRARFAAGRDDAAELKQNLLVIAEQADRITRVVQQLLEVARPRTPRIERVDLGSAVRSVVELLGPQARQQNVDLRVEEQAPAATAGDPDSIQQVVFNLALNAVQAQPEGGSVVVIVGPVRERDSLGSERPRAVVEVRDRGPGVPIESREAIFEPFASTKVGKGGTGLGLALVREIVRQHGGTVRVLDHPGGGAIFRVSLPAYEEATE